MKRKLRVSGTELVCCGRSRDRASRAARCRRSFPTIFKILVFRLNESTHSNGIYTCFLNVNFHGCVLMSFFSFLLFPCQWKYWHRAKNRLRDKTGFRMYNPQNVEKSGFGRSVCVSVCLSLFPRALTSVRFNRSSWNFRGMFGYIGHCAVPIFEAIREPVYKIT